MNMMNAPAEADSVAFRLRIQNIVGVARVTDALPLVELAAAIPGTEYPKRDFPGLFLRIPGTKVSCHLYESGKIMLTGLVALDRLQPALRAVVDILRAAGVEILEPVLEARVVNLVASGNLGERVALLRLALTLNLERVEYDPEHFAAIVYRARAGGTALVYASGRFVVMGVRSIEQAQAVALEVWDVIDAVNAWHSYA